MHNRRARPTLRVLMEDLRGGWESPYPQRLLANGQVNELAPISELPHPLIRKALQCFGQIEGNDIPEGRIASSSTLTLWEVKVQQ